MSPPRRIQCIERPRTGGPAGGHRLASPPSGTITFLFTDIEGSTRLWEQHTAPMKAALERHDRLLRGSIEAARGYVFKTVGDAFCAAFETAPDAMNAALESQAALLAAPWEVPGGIQVRMALHTGTAEERGGDYFGQTLNRVARLLSVGHGGQTLVSLVTAELLRDLVPENVSLQDLGAHRLKDLLRPESVFQLVRAGLRSDFPALRSLDAHPNNLPLQPTPFIGREKELEAVQGILTTDQVRVLTLTGIGGTGKTRLSLQAAANLVERFPDGVFFVDLSAIDSPAHLVPMIARTLEVRETGASPLRVLLQEALRDKRTLLILDNFEQVLKGVPHVVDLLAGCPLLKILVTSREALHIRAERVFRVPPLSVPKVREARSIPLARLTQYEAVSLFIDRAIAIVPDFTVTNETAPAVAEICARLDGLPLAIELAAARVNVLAPAAILERLSGTLKLLSGGGADLPFRQRTLRATIDWSYRLLSSTEQQLFREAAVFSGGCTLEAVEALCRCGGEDGIDVMETLASLVDKSLLSVDEHPTGKRFVMLESLREYGLELLERDGVTAQLRDAHARWYLERAERAHPALNGPNQRMEFDALEADHDNFHRALSTLHENHEPASELLLCVLLGPYWQVRGRLSEGVEHIEAALATAGASDGALRARVLYELGVLLYLEGAFEGAVDRLRRAARAYREANLGVGIAACCEKLAWVRFKQNEFEKAQRFFSAMRSPGLRATTAQAALADKGLACIAYVRGEYDRAQGLLEGALRQFSADGNLRELARVLDDLTTLHSLRKDYRRALAYCEEAQRMWDSIGDQSSVMITRNNRGFLSLQLGLASQARESYEALLAAAVQAGNAHLQSAAHLGVADACLLEGDPTLAAQRAARAEAFFNGPGWDMERGIALRIRAEVALRGGAAKEAISMFEEGAKLLRMVNDTEDLELALDGAARASRELERARSG